MLKVRHLVMRASWYIREFGDWLYLKALGHNDYTTPYRCNHCGKWNFEKLEETEDENLRNG